MSIKLNEELLEQLQEMVNGYLNADESDNDGYVDKNYGPLFHYVYIRDFLTDEIVPEIDDVKMIELINELDKIVSGDDPNYDNSYKGVTSAIERCRGIINEIDDLINCEDQE